MERVYHYTTMNAFLSLLESIKESTDKKSFVFRATNIFFLNDPQEFIYGQNVLMDVLREIEHDKNVVNNLCLSSLFKMHKNKSEEKWFEVLRNSIHEYNESPYVISFSRNEDSLPMWLNYGEGGRGVCLAFAEYRSKIVTKSYSPKDLIDAKVEIYDQLGTYDVNYDAESIKRKDNYLRKQMEFIYDYYLNKIKEVRLDEMLDLQIGSLRALTEVTAPYIKTKDFEGEKEVRLSQMVKKSHGKELRDVFYRCNAKGHIVPYIKIEIPVNRLDFVRLGPLVDKDITINVVKMIKRSYKLDFYINESGIAYRDY